MKKNVMLKRSKARNSTDECVLRMFLPFSFVLIMSDCISVGGKNRKEQWRNEKKLPNEIALHDCKNVCGDSKKLGAVTYRPIFFGLWSRE
jgi:hypothetical protein